MMRPRYLPGLAIGVVLAVPLALAVSATAFAALTPVSSWSELQAAMSLGEQVILDANITDPTGAQLNVADDVSAGIDLNGHSLVVDNTSTGAGIRVDNSDVFSIDDSAGGGTLSATGGTGGAGIGSNEFEQSGMIDISGGSITAIGGSSSAGIGGGAPTGSPGPLSVQGQPRPGSATTGSGPTSATIQSGGAPSDISYSAVATGGINDTFTKIVIELGPLVSFNSAGGSAVASEIAPTGVALAVPAAPTKAGYKFVAWTLNGKPFDFSSAVSAPITLTATYAPVLATTGCRSDGGNLRRGAGAAARPWHEVRCRSSSSPLRSILNQFRNLRKLFGATGNFACHGAVLLGEAKSPGCRSQRRPST